MVVILYWVEAYCHPWFALNMIGWSSFNNMCLLISLLLLLFLCMDAVVNCFWILFPLHFVFHALVYGVAVGCFCFRLCFPDASTFYLWCSTSFAFLSAWNDYRLHSLSVFLSQAHKGVADDILLSTLLACRHCCSYKINNTHIRHFLI